MGRKSFAQSKLFLRANMILLYFSGQWDKEQSSMECPFILVFMKCIVVVVQTTCMDHGKIAAELSPTNTFTIIYPQYKRGITFRNPPEELAGALAGSSSS